MVGPRRSASRLAFEGAIDQVNVSFFPGEAGAFFNLPMSELSGRMASPDDAWPRDFREMVAELAPLPVDRRVSRLTSLLLARLEPRREPGPPVRAAIRLIRARRGRVSVRALAAEVGLSVSQLERGFTRHVGLGPKMVARQARVSALAAEARAQPRPQWARLAASHGYADQAHLVHDFRDITGFTPTGLTGPDADFLQDAVASRQRP